MLVYGSPTADVVDLSLMSADLLESRDDIFFLKMHMSETDIELRTLLRVDTC